MVTTLSSKGQVVIPEPIRRRQQMQAGDQLEVEEREDGIVLRKVRRSRKKSLLQWMQDCPAADFKLGRVRDLPRNIEL
jgi:AbrB family looped-hinge helix DNA binding protein